jgi:GNAT superfamily N-acetyltransferase
LRHWLRPDGRCFVYGEVDDDLPPGRLHATADEQDEVRRAALAALGFVVHRRELVLRLPTEVPAWPPPPAISFRRADQVDEEALRLLDDLLRQDVPGTDGWTWSREAFREETYEAPAFDPATYLVAVDDDGDGVGIARVWMRPEQPRLGLIGVRADRRRRGIARALLAGVLAAVRERGAPEVRTEVAETNAASRNLLFGFGAEVVGATLELVRPAQVHLRRATPEDAAALADVQVRSLQVGFTDVHPAEALASLDRAARVPLWRERLPLVAAEQGTIVGLVHFGPNEEEPVGEIHHFFVVPERWGEGVGRALMARALAELRAAGFSEAMLWVHAENGRARRFYEAGGWRPDGAELEQQPFGRVVTLLRHRIRLP